MRLLSKACFIRVVFLLAFFFYTHEPLLDCRSGNSTDALVALTTAADALTTALKTGESGNTRRLLGSVVDVLENIQRRRSAATATRDERPLPIERAPGSEGIHMPVRNRPAGKPRHVKCVVGCIEPCFIWFWPALFYLASTVNLELQSRPQR